jgi:hypothetical protein
MATKLALFNNAILELGHTTVVDTGEPVIAAASLVRVFDGVVKECLANASWNFAMETIKASADTGVAPNFGYTEVFAKPSDWLRTIAVSQDEYFSFPELHYYDDSNFWSADNSPLYIRYVSDDTGLGYDLTRWPQLFTRYVELELAARVCYKITQSRELLEAVKKDRDKARLHAKNVDAMDEVNPKFPPPSSWTTARQGRTGSTRDRGSRGNLTG